MKKTIQHIALIIGLVFISVSSFAQEAHILYGFNGMAQSTLLNPAYKSHSNFTIGIPIISSINVRFTSQLASLGDLSPDTTGTGDDLIGRISNMEGSNYLYQANRVGLFFFGAKIGETGYLSLGANFQTETALTMPADLLKFGVLGNKHFLNRTADFSDLGVNAYQTINYHVGYSQSFMDDKLRLGARLKYINGITAVQTDIQKFQYSISEGDTVPFEQSLSANGTIYTAGISGDDATITRITDQGFEASMLYGGNNVGIGFDLGAIYDLNDQWSFSASARDLGSIKWIKELESYDFTIDDIEYNGVDYNAITDTSGIGDVFEAYFNAQEDKVQIDTTAKSFTTKLNSDYFLGVHFRPHDDHEFVFLYQNSQVFSNNYSAVSMSYYGMLTNWFHLKASYAYVLEGAHNLGAGFALGTTVQLYAMGNYFQYANDLSQLDRFSFRLGVNVNWGYPEVKAERLLKKEEKRQRKLEKKNANDQPTDTGYFLLTPIHKG